ncbi:inactive ubiquitin carboxyl-terminal hydrolase 53 [Hyla sarda]|uniref:inactive ubiquitin carboxyl-terminal hydrolase 53 n=1 Tax=Hyla sarda TaxID=327740 RepID=UPI0024C36ECC|nr:inactive ubiquitin carboxyl-terminal hydrolase 53 [Hyla sarda]
MAWVKLFRRQAGGNLGKVYQPGSMLSLAPTKGLFNEPGQNSCFLNSAVQVLWQLDIFRRSLRGLTGHVCLGEACIFCALKSIFSQFQTSREKVLPSDAMRLALAESFKDEHRFQLGLMDDAAECFENILQRIHFHIVPNSEGDMCTSKSCITHQKFAMTLYEQCVCRSCGASSDPLPFTEFVRYISTTALCNEVDRMLERHERLKPEMFAELLQAANTSDDYRKCPSNCGQKIKIRRVLMNCPEIVTIGLVWDSENSDLTEDVVRNLATQLYLPGLFFRVTDEHAKESRLYLVGMICYTSRHYCAFAYHTKSARWVLFDDASVKEVGTKWKDVVTKCIRCHYQPLLLFYANPDGTAVTTDDALRQVMHWTPYKRIFNNEDTANDRMSATSKKSEYNRDRDFGEHIYQNSGYKLQNEDTAFNCGGVQSSAGRGPVKLGRNENQEKLKDLSRECAQRANHLKSASSAQRKPLDKTQKKEPPRPKEQSSGAVIYPSKSFSGTQLKPASSPTRNGFRQYPDPHFFSSQGRGPYKQQRPEQQPRQVSSSTTGQSTVPESRHLNRVKNNASSGYDTDSSQEYREKTNGKNRKPWRPMRETLNVDSIFNENEKSQSSPRHIPQSNGKHQVAKDQNTNHSSKESPKKKVLMTIYEDEVKQESGSRSSLESLGKGQTDRNKINSDSKMYHLDSWQRAESGYESSDHISSGSSNLDSPIIEGTSFADMKGLQESLCSDHQQPGNGFLSTSPHSRSQLNGYFKDYNGLDRARYEDRLSPVPREPLHLHSPSGKRKQIVDRRKDIRSPTLSLRKEYNMKEVQVNKPEDSRETSYLSPCSPENCCLHIEHSPVVQTNGQANSPGSPSAQCSRVQYINAPYFSPDEEQASIREDSCYVNHRDLTNLPPPLPPKKYTRNAMSRTEQSFAPVTPVAHLDTLSRLHSVIAERHSPGDFVRPDSDIDYYPKKDEFHGSDLQISMPNVSGSSMYDCRPKMVHQTMDPISHVNDTVSLTTYFSVDNCMTDTYRLKYHQKPKVYMTESTAFLRDPGHLQVSETVTEPSYHRHIDNAHHSLSRSKAFGTVPCNR